jgi:hypothetical protein
MHQVSFESTNSQIFKRVDLEQKIVVRFAIPVEVNAACHGMILALPDRL